MIRRCRYQHTSSTQYDDMSQSLFDLAGKLKEKEKWADAESAYLQVLSRRERDHGIEDDLVRDSYYHLGLIYHQLDRLHDAALRLEAALNGEEKVYGLEDNRTLYTAFELAKVYRKQKKNEEAIIMYTRAISREAKLGAGDSVVRLSRYNLATIYEDLGQLAEASRFSEAALKGEEEVLGLEHDDTLITVSQLADVYKRLGQFDDSERGYNRVLAGREKSLGPDHKKVLDSCYNLGLLYKISKNFVAAEKNFSRAMTSYEKIARPNNSEVLDAIDKLVEVLILDSRFESAEDLCRRALQRRIESLGHQHTDTKANEKMLAELTEKLQAAKVSVVHRSSTSGLQVNQQSSLANPGLETSIIQLIDALPRVPNEQQPISWDQRKMQMVLSGNLGLETKDMEGRTALLYAVQQNCSQDTTDLLT